SRLLLDQSHPAQPQHRLQQGREVGRAYGKGGGGRTPEREGGRAPRRADSSDVDMLRSQEERVPQPPALLDLLACPKCHAELLRVESPEGFACEPCQLFYAVEDGLPNMLIDDAKTWPLSPATAG